MRYLLLTASFYLTSLIVQAQTGAAIIAELQSINQSVTNKPCGADSTAAISHRAMNIFLADKTGYLSASRDLSFYTNYAAFSTAEGKFTVNHNFQQATSGTSRIFGGTGLGLAIVKQLVEAQDGNIAVKSKINEGTVFSFSLSFQKTKYIVLI